MTVEKNGIMANFYETKCLPVITWNKEHSSDQVLPTIHTQTGGKVFCSCDFWRFVN